MLDDVSKRSSSSCRQDGRRPYAAIGKAVGLSEAAVRQRVQRLLDAGVMQIVAVTDPLQVGFSRQAMIGVRAEGDLHEVADTLAAMAEVDYVVITAGSFDVLVEAVCEDDDAAARAGQQAGSARCPGRPQHRDVRVPEAAQAALQLGNPMTATPQDIRATATAARTPRGTLRTDARATTCGCTSPGTRRTSTAGRCPVIVRGEGAYIWDAQGKRYLDGLAGLFAVQVGHGRTELAEAAAKQAERAGVLPAVVLRAPRRDRPGRAARRTRRPAT